MGFDLVSILLDAFGLLLGLVLLLGGFRAGRRIDVACRLRD